MKQSRQKFVFFITLAYILSTGSGIAGAILLFKGFTTAGWILVGLWLALFVPVRALILKDMKNIKDKKNQKGENRNGTV
ncbi:MAG: hypothetical protein LBR69_04555 [Endomicrobium sp.]|jgi:hypothetical protein|nr:hypothetical protein [Endomicrobium sp.]